MLEHADGLRGCQQALLSLSESALGVRLRDSRMDHATDVMVLLPVFRRQNVANTTRILLIAVLSTRCLVLAGRLGCLEFGTADSSWDGFFVASDSRRCRVGGGLLVVTPLSVSRRRPLLGLRSR